MKIHPDYNWPVVPLSLDTAPEIEQRQIAGWRAMSPAEKLRWYRHGGEASDRQWRDILGIVRVQGSRLDVTYLRLHAPVLGVADLLERAIAQR